NKPNVAGKGHAWKFDLDYLTNSMNYEPVSIENQAKKSIEDKIEKNEKPLSHVEQVFLEELEKLKRQEKEANDAARKEATHDTQDANINNTNQLNVVIAPVSFVDSSYDDEGVVTNFNNLETTVIVSTTPTTKIHTIHPKTQILGDPLSAVQTRSKVHKNSEAHALLTLEDESWVDAMQEELLQFKIQKVWILVDLPFGKKAIRTKWVYKNKKDERGVVVRNKARLVAQGHRQEEGIDYDEKEDGIFISQDKYVAETLKRFDFPSVKTASTLIKTQKPLVKDEEAGDVDILGYTQDFTPSSCEEDL
nr:hypothetical protein [Tanacetum cinerariifolium]